MRTEEEIMRLASRMYKEGSAVVDMKFNEVFRFTKYVDARVVVEHSNAFRTATAEEAKLLEASGETSCLLK